MKSREDAEDVVQDIFAHKVPALLTGQPGLNPEEMGRMLSVITRNHCIDKYRRRNRFPETELIEDYASGSGTDTEAANLTDSQEGLENLMTELTPKFREVLTLKYIWDLTWEEVATRLGLSHAGVRKRADQAKKELARKHQERNADGPRKGGGL